MVIVSATLGAPVLPARAAGPSSNGDRARAAIILAETMTKAAERFAQEPVKDLSGRFAAQTQKALIRPTGQS